MSRVTVTASIYHAALAFAGVKDVRSYLNGVRVEPAPNGEGVILIGCDGRTCAVFHDAQGSIASVPDAVTGLDKPGEPVTLPRLKLAAFNRKDLHTVEFDGEFATARDNSRVPATYVDGRYPDWRAIVPSHGSAPEPGQPFIDTEFLARLEAVRGAYDTGCRHAPQHCGATITSFGADGACLVTYGEGIPVFVVIMPLRVTGPTGDALPAFMTRNVPGTEISEPASPFDADSEDTGRSGIEAEAYAERVSELEAEGLTTSDAQAVADAEVQS